MPVVPPAIPSAKHYRRFGWGPLTAFLTAIAVVAAILNAAGARFAWRGTPDGTILGSWDRTSSAWPEIREGQPTAVLSHDHTFSTPGGVLIAIHFITGDFDIAKKGHVHVPLSAQAILRHNIHPGARIFKNPNMFSTDPTPLPGDPGDDWSLEARIHVLRPLDPRRLWDITDLEMRLHGDGRVTLVNSSTTRKSGHLNERNGGLED